MSKSYMGISVWSAVSIYTLMSLAGYVWDADRAMGQTLVGVSVLFALIPLVIGYTESVTRRRL